MEVVNGEPITNKALTKFFKWSNVASREESKTLFGYPKGLCITFLVPGDNDCFRGKLPVA